MYVLRIKNQHILFNWNEIDVKHQTYPIYAIHSQTSNIHDKRDT